MTSSAPLGVSAWQSLVQTQASLQALIPSAVAFFVPFPQNRWRNGTQRGQRTHPSTRNTIGEPSGLNQALFLHPPALPSTGCGVLSQHFMGLS